MSSTGEGQKNPAGKVMTTVGGILGMAAVVAWLIGLKMTLTPSLEEAEVYKGLFATSLSLIVLGSIIGRRVNARERAERERLMEDERLLNESAPGFEEIRERKEETRTT